MRTWGGVSVTNGPHNAQLVGLHCMTGLAYPVGVPLWHTVSLSGAFLTNYFLMYNFLHFQSTVWKKVRTRAALCCTRELLQQACNYKKVQFPLFFIWEPVLFRIGHESPSTGLVMLCFVSVCEAEDFCTPAAKSVSVFIFFLKHSPQGDLCMRGWHLASSPPTTYFQIIHPFKLAWSAYRRSSPCLCTPRVSLKASWQSVSQAGKLQRTINQCWRCNWM